MSLHIAKAVSALHHTLLLILVMGFVSLVQAQVVGENLVLQDMTIGGGEDETYEATNTITTAGENDVGAPTTFVVKAGGSATLKARVRIELKAGTQVELGAFFRAYIDPNVGNPTTSPRIRILEPDGVDDTADSSYEISWEDEDPSYNASIFLYYDMDNEGENGTLINETRIDEDDEPNIHIWNTSEVLQGDYYIYGVIDNAESPAVVDYSEGVVSIERNDRPTIGGVPGTIVEEDTAYSFTPTANDADEGDVLMFSIVNQPDWASFDEATGRLWGIPGNDDVGVTSDIVITVMDDSGAANDRASLPAFNLTVLNVNDPPVAEDDFDTVVEDGQVWINVVANDTDVDDEHSALQIASFDDESAKGGEVIQPQPPNSPPNYSVLRYTPVDHFNGEDSFTYVVRDTGGETSEATVTVTVIPVDDGPIAEDDFKATDEDRAVWVNVVANDIDPDSDPGDANTLEFTTFTQGSNGSVIVVVTQNDERRLRYAPNLNYNGEDSFTYEVEDEDGDTDTGTVTITVRPVDDPPVAVDDSGTAVEDDNGWAFINVLGNDKAADPDGDGSDLRIVSYTDGSKGEVYQPPENPDGNVLRYRPYSDEEGEDSFTYVVRDNNGTGREATGTVRVTIMPLNDAPTIGGDPATGVDAGAEYSFTPTSGDVDEGDDLTFSIVNQPDWANFDDTTGRLWGTPTESDVGLYEAIEITVSDGSGEENGSALLAAFNVTVLKGAQAVAPWKILSSRDDEEITLYFGQHGDTPVACDYDGDGITDLAVWRTYRNPEYGDGPQSMWIIRQSSNDQTMVEHFGDLVDNFPVDIPVQADYDGDGRCDMAYLTISGDRWYIKKSSNGNTITRNWDPEHANVPPATNDFRIHSVQGVWEIDSAVPAPADYDGDGIADLGAFWPFMAAWTYRPSNGGDDEQFTYGRLGEQIFDYRLGPDTWVIYDLPVPADYIEDGEDKAQPATWRPKDREWSVQGQPAITIGKGLEIPVTGDFDGDGIADPTVFVQKPDITITHISDDITENGEWPDRQGESTVIKDNDTYRMTYCGSSILRGLPDDIFYSESSSPTGGFSDPQRIIAGSCEHVFTKLPSSINPVFEDQCPASDSIYLVYSASERYDLTNATFHPPDPEHPDYPNSPGLDHNDDYRWPQPLNEPQDPDFWPHRIGSPHLWGWEGLKIVLHSACGDDLGNPRSWVRRGPVLQIPPLEPGTASPGNPVGVSQPQLIYQDGTIYISTLYDSEVGQTGNPHLWVSTDGINFENTGGSGVHRSNRVHSLSQSNSMIGHTFHSVNDDWRGNQVNGDAHALAMSSYLHFSKDLGNLKTPTLRNQYAHVDHLLRVPKAEGNDCSYAPGVLESPHGFVEGNSTYVYANEWNYEYYCTCRLNKPTGFFDPDNGQPDMCPHRLRDNGTWSLNTGELGVSRVDFNFIETGCIGNRYSSCSDGSCTGAQRMRTCTAEDTWGDWVDLE